MKESEVRSVLEIPSLFSWYIGVGMFVTNLAGSLIIPKITVKKKEQLLVFILIEI